MQHQHSSLAPTNVSCGCGHDHDHSGQGGPLLLFAPAIFSLLLLVIALALDHFVEQDWFKGPLRISWYLVAYLPVGWPVIQDALKSIRGKDFFSEFLLMSLATIGAFAIGEYPEGVAVMLFYTIGETLQGMAVTRAKSNIKALLDQRPDTHIVLENGQPQKRKAKKIAIGSIIQLRAGEKLALDSRLLSEQATFNTAALTGESKPDTKAKGDPVLAGMINLRTVTQVEVTTAYTDSKLSRILDLVQHATKEKAPSELFIRKFARQYTPVVVYLSIAICLLPYFFVNDYQFSEWFYRALVFLVISCPCALVISIPLGYFGGIGAASKQGILFKGSGFLDRMADIKHIVTDKTGTLTEGEFKVQEVVVSPGFESQPILQWVNALESQSTHPIATAIREYIGPVDSAIALEAVEEIPGHGLKALMDGKELLVGNSSLMDKYHIAYALDPSTIAYTVVAIAYDHHFVGYLTIADTIKSEAKNAVDQLHRLGVKTTMLSGDKDHVVQSVAQQIGIQQAFGDLLPEDKIEQFKAIKDRDKEVAFVGDGINDAPVIALSDVGLAMGGLGSDATIETADVVIQDDRPIRIPMAIRISKATKGIVWQNVCLALGIKAIILALGAVGLATMWAAVFADVGVALLAILNAIRIQRMTF